MPYCMQGIGVTDTTMNMKLTFEKFAFGGKAGCLHCDEHMELAQYRSQT